LFLVVAKRKNGVWFIRGRFNDYESASRYMELFKLSMQLLQIKECTIIIPEFVENYGELGWENNISIKTNNVHKNMDI